MKKCFGIVSWLPDKGSARSQRQERLNRLLSQLNSYWPDIDILIITQNWKDFAPAKIKNNIIRKDFDKGLGILEARKTLRREFLKLDYDYLIMLDDDAIISFESKIAHKEYMKEIDRHEDGFCFIHIPNYEHSKREFNTYASAQLNLAAISRFILSKEDIPDVDPQKGQGFEDNIYSMLLHVKYASNEFYPPKTIRCTQFQNKNEKAPSTWYGDQEDQIGEMCSNTNLIDRYILEHRDLPNLEWLWKYDLLAPKNAKREDYDRTLFRPKSKPSGKQADGRDDTYLYF